MLVVGLTKRLEDRVESVALESLFLDVALSRSSPPTILGLIVDAIRPDLLTIRARMSLVALQIRQMRFRISHAPIEFRTSD